jgi:hypothetical protein
MMRRLVSIVVLVALVAPASFAFSDITGKWSGPVSLKGSDGRTKEDSIAFDFKQSGKELTGSGAPAGQPPAALKGTVDGNKVVFDVAADGGRTIHFALTLNNEHLKGTVEFVAEVPVTGTVDLQRAK